MQRWLWIITRSVWQLAIAWLIVALVYVFAH
jgi:hypothetical protein